MGELLVFLGVLGVMAAVLGAVAWLGTRVKRRGLSDAVVGPAEEIFYPTARRWRAEIEVQVSLPAADHRADPL